MKIGFKYKILAKIYDLLDTIYFRKKKTSPRQAVVELLSRDDLMILDICTGTATNAINIAKSFKSTKVIGIDVSKDMLLIAKKKINRSNVDNMDLQLMNATNLKFKSNEFDCVIISLVLHEMRKNLAEQILSEVKRVVKENGKIIVVEWETPSEKSIWKRLLFNIIHIMEPDGFKDFLKMDLKGYFKNYGLIIEDEKHCDFCTVLKLKRSL